MDLLVTLIPSPRDFLLGLSLFNPFLSTPYSTSSSTIQPSSSQLPQSTPQCATTPLSCPTSLPSPLNTCCLNYPSGHFLLAQFWNARPSIGPNDSWTLHGLWPDHCNGGYDAYCNRTRNLSGAEITSIVSDASQSTHPSLHEYMQKFWKGLHEDDDLWSHEWNKHGTCVSTLEVECYNDDDKYIQKDTDSNAHKTQAHPSSNHADLLDYLSAATQLHSSLDTFGTLSKHNITPSRTETYTLNAIQSALESTHGYPATVKCYHGNQLDEIWMHYLIQGTMRGLDTDDRNRIQETFIPTRPDGQKGNCPQSGIRYLPKSNRNGGGDDDGKEPGRGGDDDDDRKPFTGRGYLRVRVLDDDDTNYSHNLKNDHGREISSTNSRTDPLSPPPDKDQRVKEGCLIRQGQWYTSGQCATYRAQHDASHLSHLSQSQREISTFNPLLHASAEEEEPSSPLFTLTSSLGPCGFIRQNQKQSTAKSKEKGEGQEEMFACARNLPVQSVFEYKELDADVDANVAAEEGSGKKKTAVLSYRNETVFFAEKRPGKFDKVRIFSDAGEEGERTVRLELHWQGV